MLAKVLSSGLSGIEAYPVEIEVDASGGLPEFSITGLADVSVKGSRMRVKTAVKNSGFDWPDGKLTVNLAPSGIKKEGACFDLAIALGVLAATKQIDPEALARFCFLGELSLDGLVRPVKGVLPICVSLQKSRIRDVLVPGQNAQEAAVVAEMRVFPATSLAQTVEFLNSPEMARPVSVDPGEVLARESSYPVDFSEVSGQLAAKRAIEVAAAGNHNLLMIGPPGCGKTMLAHRITSILPPLTLTEALEVTKIHSAVGLLQQKEGIIARHPFRSPHHTISYSTLIGGGTVPQPGEISLAHNGVLFLDELPEFHRDTLATLRQPLEEGVIRISRRNGSCLFPSSFMLVCAMNPCPCGYLTDPRHACRCTAPKVQAYMGKVSGPLLDRIDIHVELPSSKYNELSDTSRAESSAQIRKRVEAARALQKERFASDGILYNAQMNSRLVRHYCRLTQKAQELLRSAMTEMGLSARAYGKILKVSRTIADLAHACDIEAEHVAEAVQYRSLDMQG